MLNKKSRFLGIDACRGGWAGAGMDAHLQFIDTIYFWQSSDDLLDDIHKWELALIDMPVGLVDRAPGIRQCEPIARKMLGAKRSSIFSPPVRHAMDAPTYAEACRINAGVCGKKISKQAWNILPKIRSVDVILREQPDLQSKIRESHPELCFCILNGSQPVISKKREKEGQKERLALLKRFANNIEEFFQENVKTYPKSHLGPDDIIDAMALALMAARGATHGFISIPEIPEYDIFGLRMEMVFA
jgi:predicted RNase H-like nuclease